MLPLTRRRDPTRDQECWLIYSNDVHVGSIARAVGNAGAVEKWEWRCGFYPGSRPGECTTGTAETFHLARADFDRAWQQFSSRRAEADYQAWRDQRDWTARKYAFMDRGEKVPIR